MTRRTGDVERSRWADGQFPLTPALSLGERENPIPSCDEWEGTGCLRERAMGAPSPAFGTLSPFEGERERERGPFRSHRGSWGGRLDRLATNRRIKSRKAGGGYASASNSIRDLIRHEQEKEWSALRAGFKQMSKDGAPRPEPVAEIMAVVRKVKRERRYK